MKQAVLIVLFVFIGVACEKNSPSGSHQLTSCHIEYLFFRDDIRMYYTEPVLFPAGGEPLMCSYRYDGGIVVRNIGGFIPVPAGTNLMTNMFSTAAYDSLVPGDGSVASYTKFVDSEGLTHENALNPVIYYQDPDNHLSRITRKSQFSSDIVSYTYIDSIGFIQEMLNDTIPYRKFYFENSNLVKVTREYHTPQGVLTSIREFLFGDYDDHPNPFKGKYYLRGAFFRAFSEHNYQSYTINEYGLLADSTFGIYSTSSYTMPLAYDKDGWPLFGE